MIANSYKSKQYLLVVLKVLILGLTFGYVYQKITSNTTLTIDEFLFQFSSQEGWLLTLIIGFVLVSANWYLEILKWKTVVSALQEISFYTALKQSLMALTFSLATPNRIGDYGAKAYFFKRNHRKRVLLLSFFSNLNQMLITSIFGFFGLLQMILLYSLEYSILKLWGLVLLVFSLGLIAFLARKKNMFIKGLSIERTFQFFRNLSLQIKLKTFLFSIFRYFIFNFLFYLILVFFGAKLSIIEALPILFTMYFLVSILPSILIFDVVIRGGVAVWLFSMIGISGLPVLCTVLAMWLLNFVFPSLIGAFYIVRYQPESL